jgi:hypothetical protein
MRSSVGVFELEIYTAVMVSAPRGATWNYQGEAIQVTTPGDDIGT